MSLMGVVISNLNNIGFYDFFMPFVLILAVVFGILQEKKTISSEVSVNGAIAIAVAFLATYTLRGVFYTELFGIGGMIIAALIIVILILAILGIKPEEILGSGSKPIVGLVAIIIGIMAYLAASGYEASVSPDTILTIVVLIVTFGVVYLIANS